MATMASWVDLLNPGLWGLTRLAPKTLVDAKLHEVKNYVEDKTSIFLDIRHCILETRGVERRRLHWRGLQQRRDKPAKRNGVKRRA